MKKLLINKTKLSNVSLALLYILPLLILVIIFYIYPIVNLVHESFINFPSKTKKIYYFYSWDNYRRVIEDNDFQTGLKNSTFLFFVPTFISLFLSIIVSYLISSLTLKRTRNFFLKLIYSQFFISGYTVGLAFILLFGEENLFFGIFNSKRSFLYGNNLLSIKFYMTLFQLWRSMPFNIVIFGFIFSRINVKYAKLIKIDNLRFWDRLKYLYYVEFRKYFILVTYTNLIFSFLMYPGAIIPEERIVPTGAHTLTSYIFSLIKPFAGTLSVDTNKAYAASLLVILYLLFLFIISWLGLFVFKKTFQLIIKYKGAKDV
ncbi:hypothetical protein ACR82Z_00495 [Mycoplasma sp. 6243]|uniref:hypothetical protein n=1 Tax=Mycoplasma sp. 6243 TaxID=3440865 RepID=UPI003EB78DBB